MEMTDSLISAQEHLEKNSFAEAVRLFRENIISTVPNERVLASLAIAEDQERLEFLRNLVCRHPDDLSCRLAEIAELSRLGHPGLAKNKCSAALARFSGERSDFFLKLARLRCSRLSDSFENWCSDFQDVWNSSLRAAERFRRQLLHEIVSISSTDAIGPLQQLQVEGWISGGLQELINAKITELRLLNDNDNSKIWEVQ